MTDPTDLDPADDAIDDSAPVVTDTRDNPLRYSVLKLMGKSPAHARAAALRSGSDQTLALRLGSGAHALVFQDRPVIEYPGRRVGKDWTAFQEAHPDEIILNSKEYVQARGMADSIRSHPVASRVLLGPDVIREQRIDWTWNGRSWRSTPDARGFRFVAELKTTRCADPVKFHWDALKLAYHVQAAVYSRAIEQATGVRPREFYLFAVESVAPYVVTSFQFSQRSIEHGAMLAERWHERFLECERTDTWPGYVDGVTELDVYDPEDEAALEVERVMANDDGVRVQAQF